MTEQQTNPPGNQPIALDKAARATRLSRPDRLVHQAILRAFARTGQAPSRADLDQVASSAGVDLPAALAELTRVDLIVAGPRGGLMAAYPFSATRPRTASPWLAAPPCTRCAPSTRSASRPCSASPSPSPAPSSIGVPLGGAKASTMSYTLA